jgi:hypothetical protein
MNDQEYIRDASTNYYPALVEPTHSSRREQVRWRVRHLNLSALDRETRQDAAADPGIEWDPVERQYRIRRRGKAGAQCASAVQSDPSAIPAASTPASSPAGGGSGLGVGASESQGASKSVTGPSHEREIKHAFLSKNQELDHE